MTPEARAHNAGVAYKAFLDYRTRLRFLFHQDNPDLMSDVMLLEVIDNMAAQLAVRKDG